MVAHRHFIIHKPFGYLSQFINNQTKRRNKKLLGELGNFPNSVMAIGRLDEKSEGLLLLTTDGALSEYVNKSKKIEKEYLVQVDGQITEEALSKLRKGVEIRLTSSFYTTLPCEAKRLESPPKFSESGRERSDRHGPTSWISIVLKEGKNRQIRKMTASVGFPTLRLVRVRIGNIQLNQMPPGKIMEVERFDLD